MSSPHVPAELQDHVVDHLHDSEDALKRCCLVSKSWVPRARKHLFADITLRTAGDLQSWKRTFADPSASPARYTKALLVGHPQAVTAADAEEGGWISTFSRVVHFHVEIHGAHDHQCLVPFHGFSTALKSLTVLFSTFPPSRVFDLIRSFPLLEDLTVAAYGGHPNIADIADDDLDEQLVEIQSSSPPAFTGSLELSMDHGMEDIVVRLLLLPNGLRFQKLSLGWEHEDGISLARELIERCGSTLESLSISNSSLGKFKLYLRLHAPMTNLCRDIVARSDRSFEGKEVERCDAHVRPGSLVDHLDTPNHHPLPQESPTCCH